MIEQCVQAIRAKHESSAAEPDEQLNQPQPGPQSPGQTGADTDTQQESNQDSCGYGKLIANQISKHAAVQDFIRNAGQTGQQQQK